MSDKGDYYADDFLEEPMPESLSARKQREMKPLTPEETKKLSHTDCGFYSWDYVKRLAMKVEELQAEIERLKATLLDIMNFADEDTVYMVDKIQWLAEQALKESEEE